MGNIKAKDRKRISLSILITLLITSACTIIGTAPDIGGGVANLARTQS
jgi:hypothetical protein